MAKEGIAWGDLAGTGELQQKDIDELSKALEEKTAIKDSGEKTVVQDTGSTSTGKEAEAAAAAPKEEGAEDKGKAEAAADDENHVEKAVEKEDLAARIARERGGLDEAVHEDADVYIKHSDGNPAGMAEVKSFEDLQMKPELLKAVYTSNFNKPSPIQAKTLPISFTGKNIIAEAPSGTGKTVTFTLTVLQRIETGKKVPQAVIVAPTQELAGSIEKTVSAYASLANITTTLVVKDTPVSNVSAQVIVGTPGKLLDSFGSRRAKFKIRTDNISLFVLDEADQMLDRHGLGDQTKRLYKLCRNVKQIVLTSATYNNRVRTFAEEDFVPKPWSLVKVVPKTTKDEDRDRDGRYRVPKNIQHFVLLVQNEAEKFKALGDIYGYINIGQSFVFGNTQRIVHTIGQKMVDDGHKVAVLSGRLQASERKQVYEMFSTNQIKVCVATNVGARGLDVPNCTVVVNYDLPRKASNEDGVVDVVTYVHRVGRTGRYGRHGIAFNLIHDEQSKHDLMTILKSCVKTDGTPIEPEVWRYDQLDQLADRIEKLAEQEN
eukprot:CAMPEP_0119121762 /NCGR_PEP_ID=MMETSP1310-20130426/2239_1 /TAXON_ID=464262 /ORGANISM="Genus nov. species nov., Strain RCC2339" /LENGTH=544 /DNA_ID=CAMNT_0007111339 /DNA_START=51 /DNA_END=1685 /DNA_ORIENTATION=-